MSTLVLTTEFKDGSVGRIEGDQEFIALALRVTDVSLVDSFNVEVLP